MGHVNPYAVGYEAASPPEPPRTFADDYTDGKRRLCERLPPEDFKYEAEHIIYELLTGQTNAAEARARALLERAAKLWEGR